MKTTRTKKPPLPVLARMCATCPFAPNAKPQFAQLREVLAESALTEASRICHNTGSNNAIHRRTGKQSALCRGARNLQLRAFAASGFICAPTDEAWNAKCREMAMPEIPIIKQPIPNKPKAKCTK